MDPSSQEFPFNTTLLLGDPHAINMSTNITYNITVPMDETYILKKVLYVLYMFFLPTILVLGFCGNTLSFLVFSFTPVKNLSSSVYLAALALSDNGFILTYIISWLPFVNIRIFHEEGWCQVVLYLTYVFSFLSVWYVCAFTLERFLVVFYPLRRHVLCTSRRAKIAVSSLALASLVLYTFPLWTSESIIDHGEKNCQHKPFYHNFLTYVGYVDTTITLVIPFLVIIILNSRICFVMLQNTDTSNRRDSNHNSFSSTVSLMHRNGSVSNTTTRRPSQRTRQQDSQRKVTKMLITVSTTFVILNLPSHAIRFYIYCMHVSNQAHLIPLTVFLYQHILQTLFYMNYAINFLLYAMVGDNFRTNLKLLIMCMIHRDKSYLTRRPAEVRTFSRPALASTRSNTPPITCPEYTDHIVTTNYSGKSGHSNNFIHIPLAPRKNLEGRCSHTENDVAKSKDLNNGGGVPV